MALVTAWITSRSKPLRKVIVQGEQVQMSALGQISVQAAATVVVMTIGLSACAVGTPAAITSTQSATRTVTSVELLSQTDEAGLRSQFQSALTGALAQHGVSLDKNAQFIADFAVSQRPAELGLIQIEEEAETVDAPEEAYKSKPFDECKPHRVNASLVVYSRSSGEVQGKSSGEFLACPGDLTQLSDLAQLLVDRTLLK